MFILTLFFCQDYRLLSEYASPQWYNVQADTSKCEVWIDVSSVLNCDIEIDENHPIRVINGSVIDLGDYDLTLNCGIQAVSNEWIKLSGIGRVIGVPKVNEIRSEWFAGRDSAALNAACDWAASAGLKVTGYGQYVIQSSVNISGDCDFSGAEFVCSGTPSPAVIIGQSPNVYGEAQPVFDCHMDLPNIVGSKTGANGWSGYGIGLKIQNLYSCDVRFEKVKGFETGVLITAGGSGNGKGCGYNSFFLGHIENNKVGLQLDPGDEYGWVNENVFYKGRISIHSDEGAEIPGTRMILIGPCLNSANQPNNNVFIGTCLEGDEPQQHLECYGVKNLFIAPRFETSPTVNAKVRFSGTATDNVIFGGVRPIARFSVTHSEGAKFGNELMMPHDYRLGGGLKIQNTNDSNPSLVFHSAADDIWCPTSWTLRAFANSIQMKRHTDTEKRLILDGSNGYVYLGGNGTTNLETNGCVLKNYGSTGALWVHRLGAAAGNLHVDGYVEIATSTTPIKIQVGSGNPENYVAGEKGDFFVSTSGHVFFKSTKPTPTTGWRRCSTEIHGNGSPEGVVSAERGVMYVDDTGTPGAVIFFKETDTGSSGWRVLN